MALLGGRCVDCGYDKASSALQLHSTTATTPRKRSLAADSPDRGSAWSPRRKSATSSAPTASGCGTPSEMTHWRIRPISWSIDAESKPKPSPSAADAVNAADSGNHRAALEFQHRDPKTKAFGLSEDGIVRSHRRRKAELEKCVFSARTAIARPTTLPAHRRSRTTRSFHLVPQRLLQPFLQRPDGEAELRLSLRARSEIGRPGHYAKRLGVQRH